MTRPGIFCQQDLGCTVGNLLNNEQCAGMERESSTHQEDHTKSIYDEVMNSCTIGHMLQVKFMLKIIFFHRSYMQYIFN